jgi:hypothetical protein
MEPNSSELFWWCVGIGVVALAGIVAIVRLRREIAEGRTVVPDTVTHGGPMFPDGATGRLRHLLDRAPQTIHISRDIDPLEGLFTPEKETLLYGVFEECCDAIFPCYAGEITVVVKYAGTVLHITFEMDDNRTLHGPSLLQRAREKIQMLEGMMTVDTPAPGRLNITMTIPLG